MGLKRAILSEFTRALAVLAFALLSFVHQPLAIERYGVSPAVTDAVICGAGLTGDPADRHDSTFGPCDACRIATAADLAAPPTLTCPALIPLGRSDCGLSAALPPEKPVLAGGGPRAPPFRPHA